MDKHTRDKEFPGHNDAHDASSRSTLLLRRLHGTTKLISRPSKSQLLALLALLLDMQSVGESVAFPVPQLWRRTTWPWGLVAEPAFRGNSCEVFTATLRAPGCWNSQQIPRRVRGNWELTCQ